MPQLKLSYYDFAGRAGGIRKALAVGAVPFTDERFAREEHAQRKPSMPYGKVPTLTVDGQVIAETQAILRYVGRLGGLYPPSSEPVACLLVDEMLDTFDDLFERLMMPSFVETDKEKKKKLRLEMLSGPLPDALQLIDKRLNQIAQYPFFQRQATSVFLHDVVTWEYVDFFRSGMIDHVPTTFIDSYKAIVALHVKVANHSTSSQLQHQQQPVQQADTPIAARPTKLKLTYFNMPGRAEQVRLALHIGGLDFEDERISYDEVVKRKATLPNGQIPVLELDNGVVGAQSVAILRYIGRLTGLYPVNDAFEGAKIDEIMSHIAELYFSMNASFQAQDPDEKRALREQLSAGPIPESLAGLDKRIAHWQSQSKCDGSPYAMGGETLTIADLAVYTIYEFLSSGFLDHVPTTVVDPFKNVLRAAQAVKDHPRVQDWYAKHPLKALGGST